MASVTTAVGGIEEEEEVLFLDPVLVFFLVVFGNGGAPVDNNEVLGEVE